MSTTTSTTPAKKRDASLEKLQALMKSPSAPGQEQAHNAVAKAKPMDAETNEATVTEKEAIKEIGLKTKPVTGKAQNMGLSLHPADQERLFAIEAAVRKTGIRGRPSTSLLIKLAVAAFDASRIENLAALYEQLEAQDGRRKKT